MKSLMEIRKSILSEDATSNISSEVDNLMHDIETAYQVDLFIYYNKFANTIILSKIVIDKQNRGMGIGTNVMEDICKFADNNNLRIALTPSSDFGGTKSRLLGFYKNFGFKKYNAYEFRETMVREPK